MAELAEDPKFKDMAAEAYAEAVTSEELALFCFAHARGAGDESVS